jgi:hypothetical protein
MSETLNTYDPFDVCTLVLHGDECHLGKVVGTSNITQNNPDPTANIEIISGKLKKRIQRDEPIIIGREGKPDYVSANTDDIDIDGDIEEVNIITRNSLYSVLKLGEKRHRRISLKMARERYLDYDDKIEDGFYDGGRKIQFKMDENGNIKIVNSSREVVLFDADIDMDLKSWTEQLKSIIEQNNLQAPGREKDLVQMIALFVCTVLGRFTRSAGTENQEIIKVGHIGFGTRRIRALLFKYFADRFGVKAHCAKNQSNDDHYWNCVAFDEEGRFAVDLDIYPGTLYREEDPRFKLYAKTGSVYLPKEQKEKKEYKGL